MNIEDSDVLRAERECEPNHYHSYDPSDAMSDNYRSTQPPQIATATEQQEPREETELRRESTSGSSSSSSSSGSSISQSQSPRSRAQMGMLRATSTMRERAVFEYLDRHPTSVERFEAHRLQHMQTVGSRRTPAEKTAGRTLPDFGGGKAYPPLLPDREDYVVEFSGFDDPCHAQNWSLKTKLGISAILVFDSLAATFASSVFSPAATAVGRQFHVGQEVTTLGTSLFVLGYAFGPIVWAPLSELYGRRLPIISAAFGFGVFEIAVAVAKDLQTVMICRFFAGFMGACALTICPAVFADMYNNKVRGLAVAVFSGTIFNGPLLAPMIGGFITKSYLGWRWTQYIPAFMGFTAAALALFFQKESYGPVILVEKAAELRRLTHNWGIHAKQEEVEVDLKQLLSKNISRPLRILFTEPIVLLVTFYMSFLYGILYLSLTAYGIVFGQVYGFSLGVSGLPYIGMVIGVTIGLVLTILLNPGYARKLDANNNIPVPEWRLILPMFGGIFFTIGLFWFGWTGFTPSIPWIVPTLAGLALGFGIYTVFLQLLNYIIDSYLMFAASAIAANTFLRSIFGAVFPLFATYMYDGIGINWGMTFLGCLSALLVPMPFIFYFFGKRIRAKSKFAPAPDIEQDKKMKDEESRANGVESDGSSGTEKKEE